MIASRYSVDQSSLLAGIIFSTSFIVSEQPLTSHPLSLSELTIDLTSLISLFISINNVSAAPHIPGLLIFAFTIIS